MSTGITSHADSIMSAIEMDNKYVKDILKSFDGKKNFLGYIFEVSNYFASFEIITFDGEYYLKRGAKPFWITSGEDWRLLSYKPISYDFDIDDKKHELENLGFNTEPTKIYVRSIDIAGEVYRIV